MNWEALVKFSATFECPQGKRCPVWTNPSRGKLKEIVSSTEQKYPDFPHLRGILDFKTGKAHIWRYEDATHNHVENTLYTDTMSRADGRIHINPNLEVSSPNSRPNVTMSHPWIKKLGLKRTDIRIE